MMAYRDSDGKITIDEVAAENDIKQLRQAIENMNSALAEFDEVIIQAEELSGNTKNQITEAAIIMKNDISSSIRGCEDAIAMIQTTVSKYQRIDSEVKNQINAL